MISLTYAGPLKLGDQISLSHLPENIYLHTGEKVVDKTGLITFDYNPYVIRDYKGETESIDIWRAWMDVKGDYPTLAHKQCASIGVKTRLARPRLYKYENSQKLFDSVVIHTTSSRGCIPQHVINHIRSKYNYFTFQLGSLSDVDAGVINRRGIPFWKSAEYMSECRLFIGVDSSMYWLSSCYDIRRKIVLFDLDERQCEEFKPYYKSEGINCGWLGYNCEFYNTFHQDYGITKRFTDI